MTTDEFVDNVVYTDQKLFAEDEPIPALNEGTTKNIAIAADGIAAGAGIVVEGVPTVDQRGKSRSATNPAIGSYEVEKATSIERVAVEKLFWPNPAQGNINLTEGVSNITIYDLQGSLVRGCYACTICFCGRFESRNLSDSYHSKRQRTQPSLGY